MIWQMIVALLHSNGQLRTERYGDTEKGCEKPAVQQKTTDDDDDDDDWRQRADDRLGNLPPKVQPGAISGQTQGRRTPTGLPSVHLYGGGELLGDPWCVYICP